MQSLTNKKILVTGGAGFVGSNLVRTLVENYEAKVTVLDDLFTGSLDHLAGVDYEFVHGSVENADIVNDCVSNADIVFHLACRNIIVSNKNPRQDLNVNVKGGFNVFDACMRHGVSRVVYTSTSSVYGEPKRVPITEDDEKSFLNFYSASKYSAEIYAKTFFEVFGLPVTILRYSNVYGTNQLPVNPYCGVIGKFIQSALANEPLKIFGTGEQTRDYTYIDDAINATIAAAVYPEAIGEDYNIGTGSETSVNELAGYIIQATGSTSTVKHVSNRDIDNVGRRAINIDKARRDLHYHPKFSITEGLKNTIDWFAKFTAKASFSLALTASIL